MAFDRLDDYSSPSTFSRWKRGAAAEGIGRSRGGRSTKVHLVVDALGLPLEFEVTVGERHDSRPAADLLERCKSTLVLADKAYDSNELRSRLATNGVVANIPSNGSRSRQIPYDKHLYMERAAVECTFNLFKQARRFATRYEKTLRNYAAMVLLCCIQCWLRI